MRKSSLLFSALFVFAASTAGHAQAIKGCDLVASDPVSFNNQFNEIPIPNNEHAQICALTIVATATSSGGTGYCQVRRNHKGEWTMQSGPGAGYMNCAVTCASIVCK